MSNQKKQWGAIIVMIALFAMIAFVTNLCSPMATIIKAQGNIPEVLAQIGNYGNFVAYLVMGIPAGMLIAKFGYKKTALIGLAVGIAGILIQWFSGTLDAKENLGLVFGVYLAGAFIAGLCMCILNCVVNPMLNILGGGGNSGNQLIQIGGVFNSTAAVAVYILMGALIGEITKKTAIADATPALMIALGIFVVAFVVILFTKIEEPEQSPVDMSLVKGALKYRHFTLGILAIFLYMGIEVGVPTYILQYLSSDTKEVIEKKCAVMEKYEAGTINADQAALEIIACTQTTNIDSVRMQGEKKAFIEFIKKADAEVAEKLEASDMSADMAINEYEALRDSFVYAGGEEAVKDFHELIADTKEKIAPTEAGKEPEITLASLKETVPGQGMSAGIVGLIVAVYWLMMLVGRFVGGAIGSKVSSRVMITTVSVATIVLVLFGMFAPATSVNVPGIDWANMKLITAEVPMGIFAFLLVGLCTSVMWGGIFNMAVEGLGKYTAVASGIFMTMVFGCAVMVALQALVAGFAVDYMTSYWVVVFCAAYLLFYALVGSKPVKK